MHLRLDCLPLPRSRHWAKKKTLNIADPILEGMFNVNWSDPSPVLIPFCRSLTMSLLNQLVHLLSKQSTQSLGSSGCYLLLYVDPKAAYL